MNRKSLILLLLAVSTITFAQNVSTNIAKRNVLMEDFTGIKCGNCPDGHAIVEKMVLGHPDRIFPIAVHAGSYAKVTAADQPNFIIDEGKEINEYFDIESSGYPSGIVNRQDMGNAGLVESRSFWIASAKTITTDDAKVNVWCKSSYNKDTKVISVDVELYYTSDVPNESSALCVSLLQSGILGPQAGANMGDEYVHNHVLRAMLTPTWGETISTSSNGTLVKKHYEYTLPDVIGNVDTDPQHMSIVAYVINSDDKLVLNVNGCEVECPDMTLSTTATLEAYKILPVRNNAFPYLECYLVNGGTDPLTSAGFTLTLTDSDEETSTYSCTWTASEGEGNEAIPGKQRGYVRVPVDWPTAIIKSGCDYKLKLTSLNGKSYAGATIKGSFSGMINVAGNLSVTIKTDKFADDNTFRLLDSNGNVIAEYGPYANGSSTEYQETVTFPQDGTYCFEIADAWGDGIQNPRGSVSFYDAAGNLVAQNKDIKDWGYRIFFNCDSTSGIKEVNDDELGSAACGTQRSKSDDDDIYNIAGQRIANTRNGQIYIHNGHKILK